MFCLDPFIIFASCFGCANLARKKGHSGILFAFLNAVVVIGSELTGVCVGLLIGLIHDPFLNKDTAVTPLIGGAVGGLIFGMLLMLIVMKMVPTRYQESSPRRRPRHSEYDEPHFR